MMFEKLSSWWSEGWFGQQNVVSKTAILTGAVIIGLALLSIIAPLMFFVCLLASVALLVWFVVKIADGQPSMRLGLGSVGVFALSLVFGVMWLVGSSADDTQTAAGQPETPEEAAAQEEEEAEAEEVEGTPPPEELEPVEDPVEDFRPVAEEPEEEPPPPELRIESAAWSGEIVEVAGVFTGPEDGQLTCDLLEGTGENSTDWWDRAAAEVQRSGDEFSLVYREDGSREIVDVPSEDSMYSVRCVGFGEAESVNASAAVEGVPPAPAESSVLVRITGDAGQPFSGSYGTLDGIQSVDGTTPMDIPVEGLETGLLSFDSVTANAQKTSGGGSSELAVQIVVDGEVVKESSTTAEFGLAQVTWSPAE